ncbi:MAG TPA: rhodanese-like domain-containing protein [Nocardioidaceae bacterium]|nr:rhodanese-like domain-containing protein [Nocardioidaceae bacterium]
MTLSSAALRTAVTGALVALVLVITSCATSSEADGRVINAEPREAVAHILSSSYVVLDLRPREAFEAGHVAGASNLPYETGAFTDALSDLDRDARFLLYSHDEAITRRGADAMVAMDFEHVVDGGVFGLLAIAGAPME